MEHSNLIDFKFWDTFREGVVSSLSQNTFSYGFDKWLITQNVSKWDMIHVQLTFTIKLSLPIFIFNQPMWSYNDL